MKSVMKSPVDTGSSSILPVCTNSGSTYMPGRSERLGGCASGGKVGTVIKHSPQPIKLTMPIELQKSRLLIEPDNGMRV